jgi:phage baseplate assembly protein W
MSSNKLYHYQDISKLGQNLTNIDSIIDSINNIISTSIGERFFNRSFGSKLQEALLTPLSFSNSRIILSNLISDISKFEPRVEVLSTSNVIINTDNRQYDLYLKLRCLELNTEIEMTKSIGLLSRN